MVPFGTASREKRMSARAKPRKVVETLDENPVRARILDAAFAAFVTAGYAQTSTLEIAKRAAVSKRDLYALVGNKREILAHCIERRAVRLRVPADLPEPHDRERLAEVLIALGTQLLRETTDETVIAVFRLAIAEAVDAPEVARTLESSGRATARAALTQIMTRAQSTGLLRGEVGEMVEQFSGLLWGDLLMSLLLRVAAPPSARELARRARAATAALLQLYPAPTEPRRPR